MMNIEQIREIIAALKEIAQTLARIEALISLSVPATVADTVALTHHRETGVPWPE